MLDIGGVRHNLARGPRPAFPHKARRGNGLGPVSRPQARAYRGQGVTTGRRTRLDRTWRLCGPRSQALPDGLSSSLRHGGSSSMTSRCCRLKISFELPGQPRQGCEVFMPFKSQAQRRKFAQLLVEGKISNETFEEWNRETGAKRLPERASRKTKSAKKSTGKKSPLKRTRPRSATRAHKR